jgi:outer membrane protein assembly factor BamA
VLIKKKNKLLTKSRCYICLAENAILILIKMKKILIITLICVCFFGQVLSQNNDGKVTLPDSIQFNEIIFTDVKITGNKLTKEFVIIRELDFKLGDTLSTIESKFRPIKGQKRKAVGDSSELVLRMHYSRENIINAKLFITVNMGVEQIVNNSYRLLIEVTERHYWWIFPVVKLNAPNFNEWIRDPDLSDVSMGLFFSHNNLFGTSQQMSVAGYVGKSYAAVIGYRIPWIGHGKKTGVTFAAAYQNLYTVEYGSLENKRQMLYDDNSFQILTLGARFKFRTGLYNYINVKLDGEWVQVSDSLYSLDTNFLAKQEKSNTSLSIYIDYTYDSRNSHSYPLYGNHLKVFLNKQGMGLISKDVDYFFYGIDFRFYQKLGERWYAAEMVKLENSSGENRPYYYQLNMSAKDDYIRGFDLYTLKGDEMYYVRNNLKYVLVKPNTKKVKKGQEKNKFKALQYAFYVNLFADAGYVKNDFTMNNPYNNKMLFSWGLGIDFVTYYDLVLRFEYAFTSIGTNGFFIRFGMPI